MDKFFLILSIVFYLGFNRAYASAPYYDETFIGQVPELDYSGALKGNYPGSFYNQDSGKINFDEKKYFEIRYFPFIDKQISNVFNFWLEEFPTATSCPDFYIGKNIKYMRYLFRLLLMSYLSEDVRVLAELHFKFKGNFGKCKIKRKEIYNKCRPKSQDMRTFIARMRGGENERFVFSKYSNRELNNQLRGLNDQLKKGVINSIPLLSIKRWCSKNGKNCNRSSLREVLKSFNNSCQEDLKMVQSICSESDSFYGLGNSQLALSLLANSNVLNLIDDGGFGRQCLRRFVKLFKEKEVNVSYFPKLFSLVLSHLRKKGGRYLQGDFFIAGALKEFDQQGLTDFLYKKKEEPKKVVRRRVIKKRVKKVVVKKREAPKPKVVATPVKRRPEVTGSQFKMATYFREKNGLPRLDVKMDLFERDFIFTDEIAEALEKEFSDHETVSGLKYMKNNQGLGGPAMPLLLLYLKYLIDTKKHLALFNIISVVGNKFYVLNDLDDDPIPYYVEINSSKGSKKGWQITVLESP